MIFRISASQLSFGTQGDDVARVQQALLQLGRKVSLAEISRAAFGQDTLAAVKALQQEFALPATGVVDATTVRALNVTRQVSHRPTRSSRLDPKPQRQLIRKGLVKERFRMITETHTH